MFRDTNNESLLLYNASCCVKSFHGAIGDNLSEYEFSDVDSLKVESNQYSSIPPSPLQTISNKEMNNQNLNKHLKDKHSIKN